MMDGKMRGLLKKVAQKGTPKKTIGGLRPKKAVNPIDDYIAPTPMQTMKPKKKMPR